MRNNPVKVGVVGVGALGQHHVRVYSESPAAELVGIYDTNEDHLNEIARTYNTVPFKELDALADEAAAISVAVPTDKHFDVGMGLLRKGIHLLVEKPIAATTVEAEKMVELAEDRNLILQVGHIERFNPVIRFMEGNLESPQFIEAVRLAPYPPPRENQIPRGTEVSVVHDLMIHDLDIILHIVQSRCKEIHAVGVPVLSPTEDIANVRLLFENGCVANLTASRISMEKTRKIRVFQKDTYMSLDYLRQSGQLYTKQGRSISSSNVPIETGEPLPEELEAFLKCVKTKSDPVVSGPVSYTHS
ncbi:MAG: Gfo/Idh/MocA family oxidoreductase, partial [Verrucomicrobiota bacterium]